MKRVVRSLLLFFCTTLFMLSATVCVCGVRVFAESPTYYELGSEYYLYKVGNYNCYIRSTKDSRAFILVYPDGNYQQTYICMVNQSSNTYGYYKGGENGDPSQISFTQYQGYYVGIYADGYFNSNHTYNIPVIHINYKPSGYDIYSVAIDYTYGSHSIDPAPPGPTYGLVDVKGYQTNIAGQGQAAIHNVDVISWDYSIDTNGNDITDGNVRIRIIPGEYRGSSKNDLFSKTNSDFILDIQHATAGNIVPVTDGSISYKWSDVIDALNFSSMSIFNSLHDNDTWFKRGWIYELRLEIDDYIGEWQTVYSSTSSGVENDLTIVNTSVITQNTITAIQQVNSINSTTNIWIVNGQPVDPNPEQEPPASENEKPWWVYLLEMINSTLGIQNEYINEGTDESIEVVNNFEGDHTELNTTVEDYDDIENNLVLDMNNNLEQIEVESDLIENNSFLSSARWVAEQYTTIVTDNPIGSILKFSLVLGFVMIFLGRFK